MNFQKDPRHEAGGLLWSLTGMVRNDSLPQVQALHVVFNALNEGFEVSTEQHARCLAKYNILIEQKTDLITAIDDLLQDLSQGRKKMKLYRQMMMYNDPQLNPMLYGKK